MFRISILIVFLLPVLLQGQSVLERQTGSRNFLLHYPAPIPNENIHRILDQLESDYQEFRYYFNLTAAGRTPVYLHNDRTSFLNAASAHYFETGSVYNDEIHLAPLSFIRQHATLSSVITQQAVRLVLYSRFMYGCPRWLYEGAAAYFAGIHRLQTPPAFGTVLHPSDINEMLIHPHSEDEFRRGIYLAALSFKSILDRYGEAHTVTLLRLFNGEFEYEDAVPFSLGVTLDRFERQWYRDVEQLLTDLRGNRGG